MRKQEVIDELAMLIDCIENTVEELNKNRGKEVNKELMKELLESLSDMQFTVEAYLKN